jgi:hypothetical protein
MNSTTTKKQGDFSIEIKQDLDETQRSPPSLPHLIIGNKI